MGSDPEKLFPYELMLDHLRKFSRNSLIVASLLLPLIITEDGNQGDLNGQCKQFEDPREDIANGMKSLEPPSKLDKRLRDIVIDMVRLEYI